MAGWLLLCGAAGCAPGPAAEDPPVVLDRWTLHVGAAARVVVLPSDLNAEIPGGLDHFSLSTEVELPPALRGRELVLDLGSFRGLASLHVDGQPVVAEAAQPTDRSHASIPPGFRLAPTFTRPERVAFDLDVIRHDASAAHFATVPTLTASIAPMRHRQTMRAWYLRSATLAAGALASMSVAYLLLWFLDRRRSAHGWYALAAGGFTATQLYRGMTLEPFRPPFGTLVNAAGVACATLGSLLFLHRHFALGGLSRAMVGSLGALVLASFALAADAYSPTPAREYVELAINMIVSPYILVRCLLVYRARREPDAIVLGAGVATLLTSAVAQAVDLLPTLFVPVALVLNSVAAAAVLTRGYGSSLRKADARLQQLEKHTREIDQLNVELRRQIADRSKELVEALLRVEQVPTRSVELGPGKVLGGRYRVLRQLGAGGMGAVFEVVRLSDGRTHALKVLTGAASGAALARFAQEARIAATLHHPGLVAIMDVDVSEEGVLYLVMELVAGAPLSELVGTDPEPQLIETILWQIAGGLAALHDAKIVHRDLKPANVLVDLHGEPRAKIADFGISRLDDAAVTGAVDAAGATVLVDGAAAVADTVNPWGGTMSQESRTPLTAAGAIMGTPLYMAPELATGSGAALPSSDIWSFGVLALELWTGRYPFRSPPILRAISTGEFDVEELEGALAPLPGPWSALLARCLEADPTNRPAAAELEREIGRLIDMA